MKAMTIRNATNADLFRRGWGMPVEVERRRRIRLCLWAYAYELADAPLVDDQRFDVEAYASDPTVMTGRHDEWWRTTFQPFTGQWIRSHPDLAGITALHARLTAR